MFSQAFANHCQPCQLLTPNFQEGIRIPLLMGIVENAVVQEYDITTFLTRTFWRSRARE